MSTFNDYVKKMKFMILGWSSNSEEFDVMVDGEMRRYKFKPFQDKMRAIDNVQTVWERSRSAWKAANALEKYADRVDEPAKFVKYTRKPGAVACPDCGHEMSGEDNPDGTRCPNCDGVLTHS